MKGYIKLHREFINWEWYSNLQVKTLFIHLLLRANREPKSWQGTVIQKGQLITSYQNLATECGLTLQQVRTALNKLKSTHEITYQSTSQNSIITINNWVKWQDVNTLNNKQITNEQQTNNNQITTNKNIEKEKKEENIKEEVEEESLENFKKNDDERGTLNSQQILKNWYGEYKNVHLDDVQLGKLKSQILNDDFLFLLIDELSENIAMKREKSPVYDEKYPWMHYAILKRYWQYRKTNPAKFKMKLSTDKKDRLKRLEEEHKKLLSEG